MFLKNQTTHLSLLLLTTCSLAMAQAFDPTKPTKDYVRMGAQVVATENGVASAPIALLSDSMVTFAKRSVGTASASQTVQLTNGGTLPVTIASVSLGGANPRILSLPNQWLRQ